MDRIDKALEFGLVGRASLHHRNFGWEAEHDVGGGELVADKMAAVVDLAFHEGEMAFELLVDARHQRRGILSQARGIEAEQDRRHDRAFGKMDQLEMADMIIGAARGDKRLAAMPFAQIFDNGAGFIHQAAVILDHRGLAERMDFQQLRRRQIGHEIALMMADPVGHAEFLEQPEDALRAGVVEVVYNQAHLYCFPMFRPAVQIAAAAFIDTAPSRKWLQRNSRIRPIVSLREVSSRSRRARAAGPIRCR